MARTSYSLELKEKAIMLRKDGETPKTISRILCVPLSTVRYWVDLDHKEAVKKNASLRQKNKKEEVKQYHENYYKLNRAHILNNQKYYYRQNRRCRLEYAKYYRAENQEKIIAYLEEWRKINHLKRVSYRKSNMDKQKAYCAKRRAIKSSVPHPHSLIEKLMIQNYYKEAKRLERNTGIKYHVDHIWPISKGGPHLPWNLQILTAQENICKHNRIFYQSKPRHPVFLGFRDADDL